MLIPADRTRVSRHCLSRIGSHKLQLRARQLSSVLLECCRFRLLVDAVKDYAIFMLDPEGKIMSWNAGAERLKGYSSHEVMGKHFSMF